MATRKERLWAHFHLTDSGMTANLLRKEDMLGLYKNEVGITETRGMTVAAIYGRLQISADQLEGGLVLDRAVFGIAVLPENIPTAGTGAPEPGTDSYPWMWFRAYAFKPKIAETAAGSFTQYEPAVAENFEVHSMRKITIGQTLTMMVKNFASSTFGYSIEGNILLLR